MSKKLLFWGIVFLIPVRVSASELSPDLACMAEAVYYEARDQSILGQFAVAVVIQNRIKDPRWPSTACGVVRDGKYWKGNPIRNQCQFSYWCDGKPERPAEKEAWELAIWIAEKVLTSSFIIEGLEEATHYHATHVQPEWSQSQVFCAKIGDHKFYSSDKVVP